MERNIYGKLLELQNELKAPKGQTNDFGHYKYRSNEDILEAVKPLCKKYGLLLTQSDEVVEIGGRLYVKATSKLINIEQPLEVIFTNGYAREEETKKGMDGSQITGASSSYARKYSANGLFDIDDTKDSDNTNKGEPKIEPKPKTLITKEQIKELKSLGMDLIGEKNIVKKYQIEKIEELESSIAKFLIESKKKSIKE